MDDTNTSSTMLPESDGPVALTDDDAVEAVPAKPQTTASADALPATNPLQSFIDKGLHFLSTASNETLGACLVGLGATTYVVLGRVGLVIIGVAGGVVLHATWDGTRGDRGDETKRAEAERRREAGVDVIKRVLEWRTSSREQSAQAEEDGSRVFASQALDYSSFGPEAAVALDAFTTAVIKDYVHYWYDATIPGEESFPASCRRTFTAFMLSLSGHLQRKRAADAFLDFVTNASSILIVLLNELATALNASPTATPEEAISTYLQLKPDSSLAYMIDQGSQKIKLGEAAEEILQAYLDPKSYNCPPVHTFLKEVLAQLILGYTITKCSEPAWINEWIVYGLEESETAKEVMDIVDAGVEGRANVETPKDAEKLKQEPVVQSKKESASAAAHRRKMSRAEEAMDEAMREARRLTELMIEEDNRRAQQEQEKDMGGNAPLSNIADSAEGSTQGVPTPTSSESERDRQSEETRSIAESSAIADSKHSHGSTPSTQFTSFDQIVPKVQPTALSDSPTIETPIKKAPVLTLHNAKISIFDDSIPGERASIKAKPNNDLLVQIEPATSAFPGWMIVRRYADFETLHEVLRRISVITGSNFTEKHNELPKWKVHTKASLRAELEKYLADALRFQSLAESEGMRRFLEKDQGMNKSPTGNKGFGWPTPDAFGKFGGDMMNVLTKAPKQVAGGVAGGGKAVFGGVSGLVGAVGNVGKKASQSTTSLSRSATSNSIDSTSRAASNNRSSMQLAGQSFMTDSYLGTMDVPRESQDSFRAPSESVSDRRHSNDSSRPAPSAPSSRPASLLSPDDFVSATTISPAASTSHLPTTREERGHDLEDMDLPPRPSEMPADYGSPSTRSRSGTNTGARSPAHSLQMSQVIDSDSLQPPATPQRARAGVSNAASPAKKEDRRTTPLTDRETAVAVELMFAVVSELYTLSGAWQIRKTLLTAAKTFLLRPSNPQLGSIRDLLQSSLLDANLSDSGLAHQISKLRENTLPTPEEREIWARDYPEKTAEQKEELRVKARKLLVTKGMPQALTSVMGAAASGEALGKVFDCLQLPGLVFVITPGRNNAIDPNAPATTSTELNMPRQLTISPAPYKSSYLAIPPSPFSPRLPISPPVSPPTKQQNYTNGGHSEHRKAQIKSTTELLPPPANPLHWLWQCHKCSRVYQLGVTRRCLDDGHFFCAGTTVVKKGRGKNGRVFRRHAACASEFDYQGWKQWGVWRRSIGEQIEAAEALLKAEEAFESVFGSVSSSPVVPTEAKWISVTRAQNAGHARSASISSKASKNYWEKSQTALKKDCWERCDYPSECRWGKQYGVKTPTVPASVLPKTAPKSEDKHNLEKKEAEPKTTFEDILLELAQSAMGTTPVSGDITDLSIVKEEPEEEARSVKGPDYLEPLSPTRSQRQNSVIEGETTIVSMDDLLDSVKRRKRRSSGQLPSPLGANPPSPTGTEVTVEFTEGLDPLQRSSSANAVPTLSTSAVEKGPETLVRKAADDMQVDIKKGKMPSLQERAEGFVRGLVIKKR
ncbi:hypothetical protein CERZMDRAFT_83841 [Cercospora zeae-maydis SCOH1-5]|uniref:PXA domain-containing protein n=1 Tax=Cercospora zeae-maydis SCOH1-5 TaxID=717836 RepID=A0A6A6FK12_9PEZI|nr:hypothetical protein CERZMDRAFT_83841 [Cercospora zeae-maydis SCOH1-5]